MFFSTFEKQLDAKRRLVVPLEYRALMSGPFDGMICFPSINANCIEAGGKALLDNYTAVINELEFGDRLRTALEFSVLGGLSKLSFDPAGRVTLPEHLCDMFGLKEDVVIVGLGDYFQIWEKDAFKAQRTAERDFAGPGLAAWRAERRAAKTGTAG